MEKKLKLSDNAIKILEKRYLDPGETPYMRYESMANKIASVEEDSDSVERWSKLFMFMFENKIILPNSPAIMNYGKEHRQQQGSACFVLSIKDDLNDIFDTIRKAALIHKSGGGTGYNFSSLRPAGAIVKTTGKSSSGTIPFLKAFDAATGAVSQGGARRGANMGILNVTHPDIVAFIGCKADTNEINNFNLSVGVTEAFFEAVRNNGEWELYFEGEDGQRMQFYPNGDESKGLVTEVKMPARELYEMIVEHAHKNGEPGVVFVDRLQKANSVPSRKIDATNPCGEQPLPPENSCVLASLNLVEFLTNNGQNIDGPKLDEAVRNAVRMLDNIVTINEYPIEEIKIQHDLQRRIGLGLTGLGDVLISMGTPYGSPEGRKTASDIMEFIDNRSHFWSHQLGKIRGNFPLFKDSIYNLNGPYREKAIEFYKTFLTSQELDELLKSGSDGYMRNAATTTIAPTGSLTSLLGCECYGCEPLFALGYERHILNGETLTYVSELFKTIAKREGFYSEELMSQVARTGSAKVTGVPEKWQKVFEIANEISVEDHIAMQAALQQHCDSGISKTINMAASATIEDVKDAYAQAFESGVIKGLTVYRDQSRGSAPISIGTGKKEESVKAEVIEVATEVAETQVKVEVKQEIPEIIPPIKRPRVTEGSTTQVSTGCGKMYLTVNRDEKGIIETFAFVGSNGGCQGLTEGLSRTVSLAIRQARAYAEEFGLDIEKITESTLRTIIDQLRSVRCNVALRNKKAEGKSCPDIIGKVLEEEYAKIKNKTTQTTLNPMIRKATPVQVEEHKVGGCSECENKGECHKEEAEELDFDIDNSFICPECKQILQKVEGCMTCICGYSKCS